MSKELLNYCLVFSDPVQVAARVKSFYVEHDRPGRQDILGCAVQFLLGERELAIHDYPFEHAQALVKGTIFDSPVRVALLADRASGRADGLLRIALAAVAIRQEQEAAIWDAHVSLPDGLGLWTLPGDRPGLPMGEIWFPAGSDVLAEVPAADDLPERMAEFEDACRPFFHRALYGDPRENVERLLRSVRSID